MSRFTVCSKSSSFERENMCSILTNNSKAAISKDLLHTLCLELLFLMWFLHKKVFKMSHLLLLLCSRRDDKHIKILYSTNKRSLTLSGIYFWDIFKSTSLFYFEITCHVYIRFTPDYDWLPNLWRQDIYFSSLFWCELLSFGDIRLLSDIMRWDVWDSTFEKLNRKRLFPEIISAI